MMGADRGLCAAMMGTSTVETGSSMAAVSEPAG